ncbi:nicotinic acid mononucleotide adenyltransferase [Flavobacteriaceae bacterium]|nr:nicotinic acid mononucleotide adenyltransferase [Flavobacteriaceae bacterium]MDB9874342.1 nicotinic acid mononucleotide adenyltransferase [Flavobacteriaceae bacterium]MDB9954991.1 nicotinic acid mononucleotide adenyltransferase [Flavobacteriaceae bacterium]MDC1265958.1 nicotinic acid mononucleotide adenyltransferase [Flavobacteriaceae bacterium]
MKKYILIALVFIGTLAYAQNTNQPKLEAKGDVTLATYFYENGAIQQEGTFDKKGKLEGLWTSYDFKGNKLSQGNYSNGIKTGKWFFWTENSLKEVDFVNSKIMNVNEWNLKSELAVSIN